MPNRAAWFDDILKKYERVGVTGYPRTGKSTLCRRAQAIPVVHGDDFKHLGWSESSEALAKHVNAITGRVLVEGVAVPRAVRKGMRLDVVLVLEGPYEELLDGQESMGKGVETVLRELTVPIIRAPKREIDDEEEIGEE